MMVQYLPQQNGEHPWSDRGQLLALALFMIVWSTDSLLFHITAFGTAVISIYIRLAIAIPLWILAAILLLSSHYVAHASPSLQNVVTTGVFRYIRHPLYLGSILVYLGLVIISLSLAAFGVWCLIAAFYHFIATYEERLLIARFGDTYRTYQKQTGRWLPKLR